jgi:hypothetical protein
MRQSVQSFEELIRVKSSLSFGLLSDAAKSPIPKTRLCLQLWNQENISE